MTVSMGVTGAGKTTCTSNTRQAGGKACRDQGFEQTWTEAMNGGGIVLPKFVGNGDCRNGGRRGS